MNEPGIALVVEDEEMIQEMLSTILRRQGYDVLCCEDGHTTEAIFDEHSQFVKLVLLDKILPNFNLLDFFKHIRMRRPELPIVVQTGGLFNSDAELQAMLDIRVAVLLKPYLTNDLIQAMQVAAELAEFVHSEYQK